MYCCGSVDDQVDGGGGRGGELEVRGKGHSRTVSDVSYISTGSGSQGIGKRALHFSVTPERKIL